MRLGRAKQPDRRHPGGMTSGNKSFSYYSGGRVSGESKPTGRQPGRAEAKASRLSFGFFLRRFGAILALIAVLLLLISSVQVAMKPRVRILNQANSLLLHSSTEYQSAAESIMKSSWANTNKLTIDTGSISSQLRSEYPEIADASIALPLVGQRPVLYLQLTEPQLILAGQSGQAFVVDENGRALADAAQVRDELISKLPTVTDQSGLSFRSGQVVLSSDDVSFIRTVVYQLGKSGVIVSRLVMPAGSRELDVYPQGSPYFVKFNLQDDSALRQAGDYLAVRQQLSGQGKQPAEYIDVRLTGRAYYK